MTIYQQTTGYTSAVAGLMMLISRKDPSFELTRENEFAIWHESAALPVRGASLYGLAISAKNRGLDPEVYVEEPDYKFPGYRFKSYTKKEIEIAAFSTKLLLEQTKDADIPIYTGDFDFEKIKKLLGKGKMLIVRLIVGVLRDSKLNRRNSHYIPIVSFDDESEEFTILDPRHGETKIPEQIVRESFEAVHTCKRDNRMIVF